MLPEPSFTANYILSAYSIIERSRRYVGSDSIIPLDLSLTEIQPYIDLYGCDLDQRLMIECIFAIDQEYMKEARK